jgi:DNA-binding SARP family transcriptional activator
VRLRRELGDRLVTRAPGYLLRVAPDELDLERFQRLVEEAEGAEPAVAAERLRDALALWRGSPLADLAAVPAGRAAAHLGELRLSALEDRIDADLALGRHVQLVPELEKLVARDPHRERLRRQLILALYRSGRQADALEAYASARRTLVEEP